jgi:hypothetical protein
LLDTLATWFGHGFWIIKSKCTKKVDNDRMLCTPTTTLGGGLSVQGPSHVSHDDNDDGGFNDDDGLLATRPVAISSPRHIGRV